METLHPIIKVMCKHQVALIKPATNGSLSSNTTYKHIFGHDLYNTKTILKIKSVRLLIINFFSGIKLYKYFNALLCLNWKKFLKKQAIDKQTLSYV
ncbi:MAG: hypothetical protein HQK88_06520 [Nitrospirae bacterium]|nr:hypothetical protein [Nitrospirota bacterium]MBF0534780.1 hypothetical protein [Nitrospirota bacterium]MBF0616454.1 hypothetical protein [Nitrospirota bacterium]